MLHNIIYTDLVRVLNSDKHWTTSCSFLNYFLAGHLSSIKTIKFEGKAQHSLKEWHPIYQLNLSSNQSIKGI
jgi:hypothetical protein